MSEKILLVTGGSSEIGRALIRRLVRTAEYSAILAHYHSGGEAIRVLEECAVPTCRIVPVQADFRDPAAAAEMARRILSDFGAPCGIAHLPASPLRYERFRKTDWARMQEDLTVQLNSIAVLLQHFLPALPRTTPPGQPKAVVARIVFLLSSVTLGLPPKHLTAYSIVKSALLGLMRSIAVEYGSEGVIVNSVSPSMVETQFLREIPALAVEAAAASHPRGRNATVEEVCGAIEFLLSPAADYLNGVNLPVTGGLAV